MPPNRLVLLAEPVLPRTLPEDQRDGARRLVHRVLVRAALGFPGWRPRAPEPLPTALDGHARTLMLGPAPGFALRACLHLRASLRAADRSLDLRLGAGLGRVEGVGPLDLSDARGEGVEAAAAALAGLGRNARMAPGWARPPADADRVRALFALADALSRRWTLAQAELARDLLRPGPGALDRTAEETGLGRPTLRKSWRTLGGWALEAAMEAMERPRG
jgi:hypothetical protein